MFFNKSKLKNIEIMARVRHGFRTDELWHKITEHKYLPLKIMLYYMFLRKNCSLEKNISYSLKIIVKNLYNGLNSSVSVGDFFYGKS